MLFFFNWLKISHRFHFCVLEHLSMKSDGRTVRTTVRAAVRTNTGRFVRGCRQHKPRNNPILKLKMTIY